MIKGKEIRMVTEAIIKNGYGFCEVRYEVFSDGKHETTNEATFYPNKKKLNNRTIDFMIFHRDVTYQEFDPKEATYYNFDYKKFCEDLLSDEKSELDLEESTQLFEKMKKEFKNFTLGSESTKFEKHTSNGKREYQIGKYDEKELTIKNGEEDNIFISWIKVKDPEKMLSKKIILGLGQ